MEKSRTSIVTAAAVDAVVDDAGDGVDALSVQAVAKTPMVPSSTGTMPALFIGLPASALSVDLTPPIVPARRPRLGEADHHTARVGHKAALLRGCDVLGADVLDV